MYCPVCGGNVDSNSAHCPYCGAAIANQNVSGPTQTWSQPQPQAWSQPQPQPQPQAWSQPQPQAWSQPQPQPQPQAWSQPQPQPQPQAWSQPQPQPQPQAWSQPQSPNWGQPQTVTPALGMKWFKFLIYFALFASAVLNAVSAVTVMTGAHYDGKEKLVYAFFDGLESLDMGVGVGYIVLAVLTIVTRFCLSGYKASGPKLLVALYLANAAVNLIYLIGANSILSEASTGVAIDFSAQIPSLIFTVCMAIINYGYFKKRAHLFVN